MKESERVKERIYSKRTDTKSENFDYIKGFSNRVRRHKHLEQLSPLELEKRQTSIWGVYRELGECQGLIKNIVISIVLFLVRSLDITEWTVIQEE